MDFTKDILFDHSPTVNQDTTITYHGFLSDSENVNIVYGFGENWENTTELNTTKTENGFVAKIKMFDFDTFNFCFKNSNNVWDNNNNCNYISPILPCTEKEPVIQKFDIDALIEEILQPLASQYAPETSEDVEIEMKSEPINLGIEVNEILSQINDFSKSSMDHLAEYSTLEEILSCEVISERPIEEIEEFENNSQPQLQEFQSDIKQIEIKPMIEAKSEEKIEETSLAVLDKKFMVSPRKLSKFYTFKKRIKLAFYKALVKLPQMIFGTEKE